MDEKKDTLITKFINSFEGKQLLKKHTMLDRGIWKILGPDPNCDFAGPHIHPNLGLYRGELKDIISYAVSLPQFWSWGPGSIVKEEEPIIIDIDEDVLKSIKLFEQQKSLLENKLKEINEKLNFFSKKAGK